MTNDFQYDVFLSHSAKDKAVVCVPFPLRLERGEGRGEVSKSLAAGWAFPIRNSEFGIGRAGTFRFRDPLNQERRSLALRLDDDPIKGSLAQFLYINWRPADHGAERAKSH